MSRTSGSVVLLLLCWAAGAAAAASPGQDRLRELAILPTLHLATRLSLDPCASTNDLVAADEVPVLTARLRQELAAQPEDLERQLRLARLLKRAGDAKGAAAWYGMAAEAARKRAASSARDAHALAGLGEALFETGRFAEAEENCRQAIRDVPNDAGCWLELGLILDRRAASLLMPDRKLGEAALTPDVPAARLLAVVPRPETLRLCEALRDQATTCFDRAVSLAARDPEVFLRRASHRCSSAMLSALFAHFRGLHRLDAHGLAGSYFTATAVPDLQQAARLKPDTYQIPGSIAFLEWLSDPTPATGDNPQRRLASLPEPARKIITEAMTQLDGLGQNADKKLAAGALETLAMLKIATAGDFAGARTDLGRAVVLDATRENAWELLIGACSRSATPEEVTGLCRVRLSLKDNAHNRLLLAKALARQGKWDEAAAQAEATLQLDPDSLPAHLLLVAVDLRRSTDPGALNAAAGHLFQGEQLLGRWPRGPEKDEWSRELALNAALLNALGGEPQAARNWAETVLKRDANDRTAREILGILDSSAPDPQK